MMVFLKKVHKWVGLLIGIQLLLWLLSGLMLSLLNPQKVSGAEWARQSSHDISAILDTNLLEPHELSAKLIEDALNVSLEDRRGQSIYRIRRLDETILVNASNGEVLKTNESDARILAQQDFTGNGVVVSVESGLAPDLETRSSRGDYWQVNFSNSSSTSIYISASTGEILERRNSYWRVFDFFWMLHIMDYSGHEDFNNSLIISIALIAIWLGLSGFTLLFYSFNRHDFYFLNILGKQSTARITLIDPQVAAPKQVKLRQGSNLFLSLATHDINLPSICGGGGECGKCRVQFDVSEAPGANSIELAIIPRRLREQGWRLACQQEVANNTSLHLRKGTLTPGQ
ncbi:MAG: 2Fe-2S iron-sulfur cluster binding domain-containing protein [Xanthomonadales bacterium]|nr:2Fe-2S iron-sulfur cluster binding domain-containing protein [Xanthomonadales bacterium]